jgi:Plasmid encoded RepA protein
LKRVADILPVIDILKPRATDKLLEAATAIKLNPGAVELAFLARQLVSCTLPHANPGDIPVWTRSNGYLRLGIQPGADLATGQLIGYPYGSIPRLLLYWINSEAVRTRSRRLELGHHLAEFMRKVGLDPSSGGGPRSDARRLRDQMKRLFAAKISFEQSLSQDGHQGERHLDMLIAPKRELWWDHRQPQQSCLWGSWIELSEDFFKAITEHPVPVDVRALRALRKSPLALDIYAWLSYRSFTTKRPAFIPWPYLAAQFGAEYGRLRAFRVKFLTALAKVKSVLPGISITADGKGITVHPCNSQISGSR